jgi:hypothetical protein
LNGKEDSPVKKALLSLAMALVAANSAFAATAQAGGSAMPVKDFGTRFIAEAYPVSPLNHTETIPCEGDEDISPNSRWSAFEQLESNSKAVGGVLSLAVKLNSNPPVLDTAAFAACTEGGVEPFVQNVRLIKRIPGSDKCPTTYEKATFFQFGSGIRTWWTLIYTQPGTTFTLELTVRCLDEFGHPSLHIDRYTWEVVATFESLLNVIDVLHTNALGTTEIPCISSEDMYDALVESIEDLAALGRTWETPEERADAQDALFNTEALVIGFACFTDCFVPQDVFSAAFPPANSLQFGDYGFTGLIDTLENPCACKILVDLEYIAKCYNIVAS